MVLVGLFLFMGSLFPYTMLQHHSRRVAFINANKINIVHNKNHIKTATRLIHPHSNLYTIVACANNKVN